MRFVKNKKNENSNIWCLHGNVNAEILIAGHSNSFALMLAVNDLERFNQNFAVVYECKPNENEMVRSFEYWDYVKKIALNRNLVISWDGNLHNVYFLIESGEVFRVYPYLKKPEGTPVVSIKAFETLFSYKYQELSKVIQLLNPSSELIFIGTPPPKPKIFIDQIIKQDVFL